MNEPTDPGAPEPPRREFRFKPTEFERTNRPLDEADDQPAVDLRTLYRQANAGDPAGAPAAPPAENEVHDILRANLQRDNERGLNDVVVQPRRPSRRRRDYWLLLIGGNLLFGSIVLGLARNVVALLFAGSGMIIYSIGLTWVMWFIMDDY